LKRHVSKLVDDQELVSVELPLQTNLLVASLQQLMDESRGGVEANRQPRWQARDRALDDVRLAGGAVADRDDVLPAGHILRVGLKRINVDCAICDLALVQSVNYIPHL
jgi:hypothetical protein